MRQRHLMLARVLGPGWRQRQELAAKINLAPLQLADRIPALTSKKEQARHIRELVLAQAAPQLAQFILGEHPLTTAALIGLGGALDRIGFKQSLSDAPIEE